MPQEAHLLVAELLGDVLGGGAADVDPGAAEHRAGGEDEEEVEDGVERVVDYLREGAGGGDVVRNAADGLGTAPALRFLPLAEEADEDVGGGAVVQQLGHEVQVADEGRLQDDGHVAGVEELDGVAALAATVLGVLHGQVDPPALEVDHHEEDHGGTDEVGEVGEVLAVERLHDGLGLVLPGDDQVEKGNDGTLKLSSLSSVDRGGAQGLPDDVLADVSSDEHADSTPEAVPLRE